MNPSSSSLSLSSSSSSSKRKRDPNSSFAEPNSCKRPKNDMFMNYSFEDIGKSFISHLQGAASRNGFTISDHTMLPVGQDVYSELLKAIKDSEIYVVVFSINYASSISCLDELVDIMDCLRKFDKKKVLPVFFNVEPSDVRSQQGPFKEAFQALQANMGDERVQKWKQALKDVGHLSGLHLQNGDQEKFVRKIIKKLKKMQNAQELYVTDHPVGIESRVENLVSKLKLDCEDVLVVAVFGISGIGKTTIVKATYNRIATQFDLSCFLGDIHYLCGGPNWKIDLSKELISCLSQNEKFPMINSHNDGVTKIRKLISRRKVLLVLDNVENFQQLQALGINPKGIYDGSRIIVTTRNKQCLGDLRYVPYNTRLLNLRESRELFTGLTFENGHSVDKTFVREIVFRAAGLPLVLEVWSRHFKHHERKQWPSVLKILKRIPHGDVQKQLQMSYDSLPNRSKKLFLDIACFFDGMGTDLIARVLEDEHSAFFPEIEIQYLVDRSLVGINEDDRVWMHDAIREMGQEIIRQENEDEPGQRTRLMNYRDMIRVLTEYSGTTSVESIMLDTLYVKEKTTVQVEALKKMSNLRLISLSSDCLLWTSSDYNTPSFCFKKLKYLEWLRCPLKCINIDMCNVVEIRLRESRLQILWEGFKSLKKLRILDVSHSHSLTKTGDFSGLMNLEELRFFGCCNLKELHSSIHSLHKLSILDLHGCALLKRFPSEMIGEVGRLTRLKHLDLSGNGFASLPDTLCQLHELNTIQLSDCVNLQSIPNLPSNITYLKASNCKSLVNLPPNMSELKFITELLLDECSQLGSQDPECLMKVTGLTSLRVLSMSSCNVSQVPSKIGNLVSLDVLDLSGNTFSRLPDSFSNLSRLYTLIINDCSRLQLLPLLPSNLARIDAFGCWSLIVMPFDVIQMAYVFCTKVYKESPFTKQLVIHLSQEEVPDWCSYVDRQVLSFVAPMHSDKKICGIILCATTNITEYRFCTLEILNKTKKTRCRLEYITSENYSSWVKFYPLDNTTLVVEAGDIVVLHFRMEFDRKVSSFGLCFVHEDDVLESKLVLHSVIKPTLQIPDDTLYFFPM